MKIMVAILFLWATAWAQRPSAYTELLDYVIPAPDQGDTAACLFMGTTGAMEIILNKKYNLKNQKPGARFDLAERFLMFQPFWTTTRHKVENMVLKFNWGEAVHASLMPFEARLPDGSENLAVWDRPADWVTVPVMEVPKIKTVRLFVRGGEWAYNVLSEIDVETVKQALWEHKSPVLINYNDEDFWHVLSIVGYDDNLQGECYDTPVDECAKTNTGSFYIRDSFGVPIEVRDTDWFRVNGNAAFVVKEAL